ncbi:hypothetical protein EJ02DRAFT_453835 [Clathrospora elynae]|uniref:F-box domain-containing protein n=1 Tax=Clathrospora elynae TaxID=706981 RepID=A0A6A5STH6_9PLEO|nr:hypothetical protein EJ02DRAFT_453835 [Clathrospora elynae]
MADNGRSTLLVEQYVHRRRTLRSFQEGSNNSAANAAGQPVPGSPPVRPEASSAGSNAGQGTLHPYFISLPPEQPATESLSSRGRGFGKYLASRGRRRGGSAAGSPSQGNTPQGNTRQSYADGDIPFGNPNEHELAIVLEQEYGFLGEEATSDFEDDDLSMLAWRRAMLPPSDFDDWEEYGTAPPQTLRYLGHQGRARDETAPPLSSFHRSMAGNSKRARDRFESADAKDITGTLHNKGAVAVMLYNNTTLNPNANDIWPECRSSAKLPARYFLLDRSKHVLPESSPKPRPSKKKGKKAAKAQGHDEPHEFLPDAPVGRPVWNLPVELVELIADHLNRDDIKALRLVSRELNHNVSQVIFQTVVVPFNTEIYGMLGPEPKPDFKGKKRAKIERLGYSWKNANGDEVYNGHGLDVFRGFGRHIRKYGMSFEINEDSLSTPPVKSETENKTSFWGNYDWPFEEYRRFDAVAGLETAADETPRMKIAFSELSKVRELALSVDSGLGWLNGPDRSIRARILHRLPHVFGTTKAIPDRRAQAQQELWNYIEACHRAAGSDVRLATLYRMDGQRTLSELKEANMLADVQPGMPYLDPQLIYEATPHDTADIPIPTSFDDPYVLDRFVSTPSSSGTGVLFSSTILPSDAVQLMNPIIPANLTKAQKEWLLETEWAQRAFVSSYMLSIIDNPTTFSLVHTLNIPGLSDRYLPMLNRSDFWDALPNLCNVTLMVIPGWRTVHKDEAGFVDTPKVNPMQGMGSFYDLLCTHVAHRPKIRNLTVGWTTGGERAEGLHARNKLLFPAPVMALGLGADNGATFASATLIETDMARLRESLLQFPHVERLRLKNCWITPPALRQFVQIHDSHKLKELVLDSVSLTAILRLNANANHVVQQAAVLNNVPPMAGLLPFWHALNNHGGVQAGGGGAHAQFVPNQQQILNIYLHTLHLQLQQLQLHVNAAGIQQQIQITALQTQLNQQIQQFQHPNLQQFPVTAQGQPPVQAQQNQLAQPHANILNVTNLAAQVQQLQHQIAAGHQPAPVPAAVAANNHPTDPPLKAQPREGSWMNIIDLISPGTNLSDFESDHSQADSERVTSLQSVEFISCGYADLPYAPFEQTAIQAVHGLATALRKPMFTRRYIALAPAMLSGKWAHLGEIVQEVDHAELAALNAGWNLGTGWEDAEAARAVEFDGLLPGGTGRFTGLIRQSDRVVDKASANLASRLGRCDLRN